MPTTPLPCQLRHLSASGEEPNTIASCIMATRRYEPKASRSKPASFWVNPDVYFASRDGQRAEASSDSLLDSDEAALPVLLAGHVGAKGFPDPQFINEQDICDAVVNGGVGSVVADDFKRDLRALDHIHRESVDDVIQYYLKDGRRPPDTKKKPKAPLWSALQPQRHTQVIPAAPAPLRTTAHKIPARQSCPCCEDVNAENSRQRKNVALPRLDNLRIDLPTTPPVLPSLRPSTPPEYRRRVLEEVFQREPLSAIIREEPNVLASSGRAHEDLFLIYDEKASLNFGRPLDQLVPVESLRAEERRRRIERDLLQSDGRFQDGMVRLSRQIRDFDAKDLPEQTPVRFPAPTVEPPPPVQLTPRGATHVHRSVTFSEESPTKFLYTPLTSPEESAGRY